MTGLLTVDLKPASPLRDPDEVTGSEFVTSVIRVIRRMDARGRSSRAADDPSAPPSR
ncbi:MAG: hypothetical protein ACOC8K_05775 [Gemmatimonadota bacterium]